MPEKAINPDALEETLKNLMRKLKAARGKPVPPKKPGKPPGMSAADWIEQLKRDADAKLAALLAEMKEER